MKKLLIILDPAHGEETPGKRSPDGRHREYKWSRERCEQIEILLKAYGYTVVWSNTTDKEIGLTKRVQAANALAKQYPDLIPLMVSLHNNAAGDGSNWMQASGIEVFTSVGRTTSDIFADFVLKQLKEWFPEAKHRYSKDEYLERDKESNFTVLTGNYSAMLVEFLFQDNKDDVALLEDQTVNKRFEDSIVSGIEECNNYVLTKLTK
ncbi:N-acetylmuramoyl-L-alanine amidase [Dysgonomonas alginatilytica]|uniref:N-acetylmuramoyl-L-alanine amidase n=1 Tax=Dysgonomonas alginatilytica TaxID=1605892 RepID=A0A2V3PMN4_9BACT|nr:N-acetylmuramoyl-L-alanine amidase [Dysgonomonas alginatilytica]PXV61253.1 N-acetylmuramoyl-L-alanine amidase [Dysgonomonas alginatilytica]